MDSETWVELLKAPGEACKAPGVYLIRWVKEGRPVPIPRILDVDRKGILYIGSAKNLRRRLRRLVRALDVEGLEKPSNRRKHTAALTYRFFGLNEHICLKLGEMEAAWVYFESVEKARNQEIAAIRHYTEKYGEAPPLNRQIARMTEPEEELDPRLAQLINCLKKGQGTDYL